MAVFWLKARLDFLGIKSSTLAKRLKAKGINRTRQAIDSWVEKKSVPMLGNPIDTKILAEALQWNVTDMLIAAGYDIQPPQLTIPPNLIPTIKDMQNLDAVRLEMVVDTLRFGTEVWQKVLDAEMAKMQANRDVQHKDGAIDD